DCNMGVHRIDEQYPGYRRDSSGHQDPSDSPQVEISQDDMVDSEPVQGSETASERHCSREENRAAVGKVDHPQSSRECSPESDNHRAHVVGEENRAFLSPAESGQAFDELTQHFPA